MQAATEDGTTEETGTAPRLGSDRDQSSETQRGPRRLKEYSRAPKRPLEEKIQLYLQLIEDGWGRNISRAKAGLKSGRVDYKLAMKDERVIEAHLRLTEIFMQKQRGKWT